MLWSSRKLEFLVGRERFIPVQVPALVERIAADPDLLPDEKEDFRRLACLLQARFHFEFLETAEKLSELFDPFNPDRDTLPLKSLTPPELEQHFHDFRRALEEVLIRSNYTKLSRQQLERCLEAENPWGVRVIVDLSRFKDIDVYYRGVREWVEPYQPWFSFFPLRTKRRQFARIAVLVRLPAKQTTPPPSVIQPAPDQVLLKLFKDVYIEELKMTSPEIRVRIRLWDKIQIIVSMITTVITSFMRLVMAAAINPILFFTVLTGCVTAAIAAIRNFISCRIRYMERLGANLYHKLVASNLAAVARLLATAEAEEVKEALLAYYILYKYSDRDLSAEDIDQLAEEWLTQQFGLSKVDFEIDDALRKLAEKRLIETRELSYAAAEETAGWNGQVQQAPVASIESASNWASLSPVTGHKHGSEGHKKIIYKAYDLRSALRRLDEWWDNYYMYANLGCAAFNHLANGPRARVATEGQTVRPDLEPPA
ncbi:MAG: DUF3754 domain-containing protein [Thermoguttaceae bacterium]|nr:DUF3754 domain-containing protein [Thermoguttaceae bacterium]